MSPTVTLILGNMKIIKIKRKYFYIYYLRYLIWAGDKDDGRACVVAALGVQSCKAALSNCVTGVLGTHSSWSSSSCFWQSNSFIYFLPCIVYFIASAVLYETGVVI